METYPKTSLNLVGNVRHCWKFQQYMKNMLLNKGEFAWLCRTCTASLDTRVWSYGYKVLNSVSCGEMEEKRYRHSQSWSVDKKQHF